MASSWLISLAVFVYAGGMRVSDRPLSLVLVTAGGIALIALITAWAALARGSSTLGRVRRWLVPIVIASPAVLLAWKITWSAQYDHAMDEWPTRPGSSGSRSEPASNRTTHEHRRTDRG